MIEPEIAPHNISIKVTLSTSFDFYACICLAFLDGPTLDDSDIGLPMSGTDKDSVWYPQGYKYPG